MEGWNDNQHYPVGMHPHLSQLPRRILLGDYPGAPFAGLQPYFHFPPAYEQSLVPPLVEAHWTGEEPVPPSGHSGSFDRSRSWELDEFENPNSPATRPSSNMDISLTSARPVDRHVTGYGFRMRGEIVYSSRAEGYQIHVTCGPGSFREDIIADSFARYGVKPRCYTLSRCTNKPYAFFTFPTKDTAQRAGDSLNGCYLDGMLIKCNPARPEKNSFPANHGKGFACPAEQLSAPNSLSLMSSQTPKGVAQTSFPISVGIPLPPAILPTQPAPPRQKVDLLPPNSGTALLSTPQASSKPAGVYLIPAPQVVRPSAISPSVSAEIITKNGGVGLDRGEGSSNSLVLSDHLELSSPNGIPKLSMTPVSANIPPREPPVLPNTESEQYKSKGLLPESARGADSKHASAIPAPKDCRFNGTSSSADADAANTNLKRSSDPEKSTVCLGEKRQVARKSCSSQSAKKRLSQSHGSFRPAKPFEPPGSGDFPATITPTLPSSSYSTSCVGKTPLVVSAICSRDSSVIGPKLTNPNRSVACSTPSSLPGRHLQEDKLNGDGESRKRDNRKNMDDNLTDKRNKVVSSLSTTPGEKSSVINTRNIIDRESPSSTRSNLAENNHQNSASEELDVMLDISCPEPAAIKCEPPSPTSAQLCMADQHNPDYLTGRLKLYNDANFPDLCDDLSRVTLPEDQQAVSSQRRKQPPSRREGPLPRGRRSRRKRVQESSSGSRHQPLSVLNQSDAPARLTNLPSSNNTDGNQPLSMSRSVLKRRPDSDLFPFSDLVDQPLPEDIALPVTVDEPCSDELMSEDNSVCRPISQNPSRRFLCVYCRAQLIGLESFLAHLKRHKFQYSDLSPVERRLFCIYENCGYFAKDDKDWMGHCAMHCHIMTSLRKHFG